MKIEELVDRGDQTARLYKPKWFNESITPPNRDMFGFTKRDECIAFLLLFELFERECHEQGVTADDRDNLRFRFGDWLEHAAVRFRELLPVKRETYCEARDLYGRKGAAGPARDHAGDGEMPVPRQGEAVGRRSRERGGHDLRMSAGAVALSGRAAGGADRRRRKRRSRGDRPTGGQVQDRVRRLPLCEQALHGGAATLRQAAAGLSGARRAKALKVAGLGEFMGRACQTAVNVKAAAAEESVILSAKATAEEKAAATTKILELARDEYANAEAALPLVDADSVLGWDPTMDYCGAREQIEWKLKRMHENYGESVKGM